MSGFAGSTLSVAGDGSHFHGALEVTRIGVPDATLEGGVFHGNCAAGKVVLGVGDIALVGGLGQSLRSRVGSNGESGSSLESVLSDRICAMIVLKVGFGVSSFRGTGIGVSFDVLGRLRIEYDELASRDGRASSLMLVCVALIDICHHEKRLCRVVLLWYVLSAML